jgi:glutathione reductase (NADPH)
MTQKFDLVVIGTGSAASTVAMKCRDAGWSVAIIDSRPFGGTCALRGCDPKKVLVGAADVADWARRMEGKGIRAGQLRIDWADLMRFKHTFTDPVPSQMEERFTKAGIAAFHGRAHFTSSTALQVGTDELEGRHFVIAAGNKPADLTIPGAEHLTTSEQFLNLESLPPRIVFIGGGYIGFEFAHVAARAGSNVTIVHMGARPLEYFDPDLVDELVKRSREIGIDIHLDTRAEAVEKKADRLILRASSGQNRVFEADMVVHSAGRVPDIDDMHLDSASVARNKRGVQVNDFLQSVSNPAVYSAGDAAASPGLPLTPVAGYEGAIVADNLLNGNRQSPNYLGIPTVVYVVPPLAAVGLGEAQAKQQGLRFKVNHAMSSNWYTSRRINERYSGYKVLIEEGSGRILGAHLLGAASEELVNLFALAIRNGVSAAELKGTIFAYPTRASDLSYML